jgi:hypothetical protein
MLVGNGIRLISSPGRFNVGGTTPYSAERAASDPYGARKNFFIGQHSSLSTRINGSQPSGVGHPYCWLWAPKAGGLASRNIIEGTSTLTADIYLGKDLSASLTGDGSITTADLALSTGLSADLAGVGTISSGDMVGTVQCAADFTGTGTISSAPLDMLAGLSAALSGSGTITSDATGIAELSADLTVTASVDFPTADQIAQTVMEQTIEAGYDLRDVIALLAARDLGACAGGPTTPAWKGLDGSTTRVTGTVDSSGNRSGITLTPG